MSNLIAAVFISAWDLLLDSSAYVLFGLLVSGLLKMFLNPAGVARHLGRGRFLPVIKAALIGVPLPLCSCGVLPAAVALKKQGANNGATTAFLIATPESGVDSIAITYALLDPIMTIARPVTALVSAILAGVTENLFSQSQVSGNQAPDLACPVDACCDGLDCPPEAHQRHHPLGTRMRAAFRYALRDVWGDMAAWFLLGLLLAGLITALVPEAVLLRYLGGGVGSMLIMLVLGIPLYICATASTPIAAALILKGVSPGAALVFLIAGPATNVTSLTVLAGVLGPRATAVYLAAISVSAVAFGMAVDALYAALGLSPQAAMGQAAEWVPGWAAWAAAIGLLGLSLRPLRFRLAAAFRRCRPAPESAPQAPPAGDRVESPGCATPT